MTDGEDLGLTSFAKNIETAARLAALGRMSGGVTHELGSPLAIVLGNAALARELVNKGIESGLEPPELARLAHFLEKIEKSANRLSTIMANLRTIARTSDESVEPVDAHIPVTDLLGFVGEIFRKTGIEIEVRLEAAHSWFLGSRGRLQQVIFHVLMNSRDAVEQNEGAKKILIQTENISGSLVIHVADNGCGIVGDDLARGRVFDPFFSTKPAETNAGLGLYVSREILKAWSGRIEVGPAKGPGTVVSITLPTTEAISSQEKSVY